MLSKFLRGLKFVFSAERLHSWLPIYDGSPGSAAALFPWHRKNIWADRKLSSNYTVEFKYFHVETGCRRVDGVKGYITRKGDFCGLLFRRDGEWDDRVLGLRSAFEITMELGEGEKFVSAWTSGTSALAVCNPTLTLSVGINRYYSL